MKTLFAVLLLSTGALLGCSRAPRAAAAPAHGYALAKSWDYATMKAKIAKARSYYNSEAISKLDSTLGDTHDSLQLQMDANNYEMCARRAQTERLCRLPDNKATEECAAPDAQGLGPKHIAQCDQLIDELPKLIDERDAALKAELKQ